MKVLQISQYMYFGGGVSFHVMEISKEIANNHNVEILTYDTEENPVTDKEEISQIKEKDSYYSELQNKIETTHIPVSPDKSINQLISKMREADVVHLHMTLSLRGLAKQTLLVAELLDRKIFLSVHTSESSRKDLESIHKTILDRLDSHSIIAVSQAVQDALKSRNIDSKVVRNGVNTNFFSPSHQSREGLLFVGRNVKRKGIEFVKESARKNPDIKHKFVTNNLENEIKELENTEVFENLTRSELRKVYQNSEALILPSRWGEGLPLVILESLACGTPVISSDAPGNKKIINSNVGKILTQIDSTNIAKAFNELENENTENKCRKESKKFSLKKKSDKLVNLYKRESNNRG
ncbi:MAG: glycosyltransferase family 4 protein [Candidatus Nanohalobium sp.]